VYPNPNAGSFFVYCKDPEAKIEIYDMQGRQISCNLLKHPTLLETTIVEGLSAGFFHVKIRSDQGEFVLPVMVQNTH
jgi:hypothetical protein